MKIAYVYHRDAGNPRTQSGRPQSILHELGSRGVEVERVFPLAVRRSPRLRLRAGFWRALGRPYRADREPALLKEFAGEFDRRMKGRDYDLVFCPGSEAISHLRTERPITFCADATFHNLVDYYWDFTGLHKSYLRQGDALDAAALQRAALAVYPSEWAARAAIDYYHASPEKVAVIPFGANLGRDNTWQQVGGWIAARRFECLKLLFLAVHWERKGGDLVIETCRRLVEAGVSLELCVVGCAVPPAFQPLPWVMAKGYLRPDRDDERRQLEALMRETHFLFLPTRAEAYGMSLCEANAFGVPVISTATGGVPTIVREGGNGFALPLAAGADDYAQRILSLFRSPEVYCGLAGQAFREFEQRLNWRVFGETYLQLVEERLGIAAP